MADLICFIPARGGSKGIPKKNIKELGGKPLIAYSIESAFKAGLARVIVSTDDDDIARIAKEYGAEVMKRPSGLSQDDTSMIDVLKNQIQLINPLPTYVILLQPTSPFRHVLHIKMAIKMLPANEGYDSVISVEQVPEKYNPAVVIIQTPVGKGMVIGQIKSFFGKKYTKPSLYGVSISQRITRRQDHPKAWIPDGSIYMFKSENLKKNSIYGDKIMLLENEGTLNINSMEDWELAESELWNKEMKNTIVA